MASSKEYLHYILEQLSGLEEITYRAMMGEFILYYRGRIVGGIYDDRLLVKPVKAACLPCQAPCMSRLTTVPNPCCWWRKWIAKSF